MSNAPEVAVTVNGVSLTAAELVEVAAAKVTELAERATLQGHLALLAGDRHTALDHLEQAVALLRGEA